MVCKAQDGKYEKGIEAFNAKDCSQAVELLKPFADAGDSTAQFIVGYCYSNKGSEFANDSIAEYYLLQSANNKFGRAMGLLSVLYFGKSIKDTNYRVDALVWAEIAAAYDPIQKGTSTRYLVRAYMNQEELKRAEQVLKDMKKNFDKIDLINFYSNNAALPNRKAKKSEKTIIPENKLGLIENPYRDWVGRWDWEKFECDSLYYTAKIEENIIDSTILKLKTRNEFEIYYLYNGSYSTNLILSADEQRILCEELEKLKNHVWDKNLFPNSKRLDSESEIKSQLQSNENLKTEKEKNMCSIIYTFSKPIYIRNNSICLYLDQKRYRRGDRQLEFSFYIYENNRWEQLAVVYKYIEYL